MNYFIGDLHLFNRNQTGEGVNYDGRPFATVAEMNQYILEHWNAKITNGDRVNGVVVVVDGDETNTVLRKGEVGVKPGQRGVAAQSGKVFGDRHGHPSRLDFGQHGLKAGTVIGHTAYTVIHEKGWVGEVMLPGILQKHGLLRRDLSRLFSPAEYKCPTLL